MEDENCHLARWPFGIVEEVHRVKDNKIRVVKVKLQEGHKTHYPLIGIQAQDILLSYYY